MLAIADIKKRGNISTEYLWNHISFRLPREHIWFRSRTVKEGKEWFVWFAIARSSTFLETNEKWKMLEDLDEARRMGIFYLHTW